MPNKTAVQAFIKLKTERINRYSDELELAVTEAQKKLAKSVQKNFVQILETKGGRISNTQANKFLVSRIDKIYEAFVKDSGQKIIDTIIDGVDNVTAINKNYYKGITTTTKLNAAARAVEKEISSMLGVTDSGKLTEGGYLDSLFTDKGVKAKIKNYARRSILTQQTAINFNEGVNSLINGTESKNGALKQFYKETAFDTISQSDRITGVVYSNELGLVFALYEGGIVPASRKFCRMRNGKVFHVSEILAWRITEAVPPNYNPITDLGGYGCRHHLNWISEELALVFRPDVISYIKK